MKKSKKDELSPFPNLQWTRPVGSEDYFDRADAFRSRFYRLATVVGCMLASMPFLAFWVIKSARSPNPVQVYADGRVFSGPLTPIIEISDETILSQMRDTVEVLLTRTEKGGVAALDDFVGDGVLDLVNNDFAKSGKMESGYSQSYSITNSRVLVSSPTWVVMGVRGLLSSRTINGYQPSELFWIAGFSREKKTDRNVLGWRLVRLIPDPEGEMFFNEELSRQRAERLGYDSESQ